MSASGYVLKWVFGPKPGVEIKLKLPMLHVGRGRTDDERREGWLLLPDPTVSRHHANIHWLPTEGRYMLEHLSQTNPTLINDEPVQGTQLLPVGSRLQIGFSKFVLERRVISLPVTASPAPRPVSIHAPAADESTYKLQALPNGFMEVLQKSHLCTLGAGVLVQWSANVERFILDGGAQGTATVIRRSEDKDVSLRCADGPIPLQDGDIISVNFCQYCFRKESKALEDDFPQDAASIEMARLYELPGYRFVRPLGSGASGEVVQMKKGDGSPVAVKFLRSHLISDNTASKRFYQEAQISTRLSHPGLLRISEAGTAPNGRPFLVSELLVGETMAVRLHRERTLTLPGILAIARQLASALDYLHGQGLVHRDVKPDNIFLTQKATVLMDYGIVRGADVTTATAAGFAMGTPAYMAPEQFRGFPSFSSDQYALGAVIFEALAGRRVFEGDDPLAQGYMHVHQTPPSLAEFRADLPIAFSTTVARMLAKGPEARFPTVTEAVRALVGNNEG